MWEFKYRYNFTKSECRFYYKKNYLKFFNLIAISSRFYSLLNNIIKLEITLGIDYD